MSCCNGSRMSNSATSERNAPTRNAPPPAAGKHQASLLEPVVVILEAVFVPQADSMGRRRLRPVSYKRFNKEYDAFRRRHPDIPLDSPDVFLQHLNAWDYFAARYRLTTQPYLGGS